MKTFEEASGTLLEVINFFGELKMSLIPANKKIEEINFDEVLDCLQQCGQEPADSLSWSYDREKGHLEISWLEDKAKLKLVSDRSFADGLRADLWFWFGVAIAAMVVFAGAAVAVYELKLVGPETLAPVFFGGLLGVYTTAALIGLKGRYIKSRLEKDFVERLTKNFRQARTSVSWFKMVVLPLVILHSLRDTAPYGSRRRDLLLKAEGTNDILNWMGQPLVDAINFAHRNRANLKNFTGPDGVAAKALREEYDEKLSPAARANPELWGLWNRLSLIPGGSLEVMMVLGSLGLLGTLVFLTGLLFKFFG